MTETMTAAAVPPAPARGLVGRVIGVLTSPKATFADVVAHPRALGVLAFTIIVMACASVTFFSTKVGKDAVLDQQVKAMESFGLKVSDQVYDQMEQRLSQPYTPYVTAASQIVIAPFIVLIVSGIVLAIFNAILGGNATFKQVFAVVAHAGVVGMVQQLFVLPMDYARETLASPTSLSVFTPFLEETSFAGRFFGTIDLFIVWWIVTLSIGLGVLYKRRTASIATGLMITYVAIALVLAAVRAALSGA